MSTDRELLIQEISHVQFTPVRLREGYEMDGVDDLLDRLVAALRAGEPVDELVRTARFTPVRMREGYDMGEVDEFLDRVVASAATADRTPPTYVEAPAVATRPVAAGADPVAPAPSVIQEQRGLLARLFKR
jgi:DivIVA domain-containing protein